MRQAIASSMEAIMNGMNSGKSQLERFKEAAREVEADESDDALDKVMRNLDLSKKPEDVKPEKK
jgi:hypothetical protein